MYKLIIYFLDNVNKKKSFKKHSSVHERTNTPRKMKSYIASFYCLQISKSKSIHRRDF